MPTRKQKVSQKSLARAVTRQRPQPKKGTAPAKSARRAVYQLKITLNDIRPPIWRRVQTKDCTLARLHDIIQAVMGWQECHLHLFQIGEDRYGDPDQWPACLPRTGRLHLRPRPRGRHLRSEIPDLGRACLLFGPRARCRGRVHRRG